MSVTYPPFLHNAIKAYIPQKEPEFEEPAYLDTRTREFLSNAGFTSLFSHQAQLLDRVSEGKHVIISTGTSSGKSLAFTLPFLNDICRGESPTALYLYPTKALSRDQKGKLDALMPQDTRVHTYDGDTQKSARPTIRDSADILISNVYGWHEYLSYHAKWSRFLSNLRYVVLDEAHVYRGIKGINVAYLIRRLRRICARYGAYPTFILSSATVGNPRDFAGQLTGLDFSVINRDGSGHGGMNLAVWHPPYKDESCTVRESSLHETAEVLSRLIRKGIQTLSFIDNRQMVEVVTRWVQEKLASADLPQGLVTSYRGGIEKGLRQQIESRIRDGDVLGINSTNALELGVDIGSLDCVIVSKYPRNKINFWQRAGRAGRGSRDGLVVYIPTQDPMNEYIARHVDFLTDQTYEELVLDTTNTYIVMGHLLCAAAELPLVSQDAEYFPGFRKVTEMLLKQGLLARSGKDRLIYSGKRRASELVSLDASMQDKSFKVLCGGQLLEHVDTATLYRELYEGAVFNYLTGSYIVRQVDFETRTVDLIKKDVDYYTKPKRTTDIEERKELKRGNGGLSLHNVLVTNEYYAYDILRFDQKVKEEPIHFPEPLRLRTVALRHLFTIPTSAYPVEKVQGGIHGMEHALIAVAPLVLLIDPQDIGGVSYYNHHDNEGVIYIYDGYEGGIGLSERLYGRFAELFAKAHQLVRECSCEAGCPSCIYSSDCGNDNQMLDKEATLMFFKALYTSCGK